MIKYKYVHIFETTMIPENEHLRQRMLFSRLDDQWYLHLSYILTYLVTPETFGHGCLVKIVNYATIAILSF